MQNIYIDGIKNGNEYLLNYLFICPIIGVESGMEKRIGRSLRDEKLKYLREVLHKYPSTRRNRLTIYVSDNEIPWDFERIMSGEPPEFLPEKVWQEFMEGIMLEGYIPSMMHFEERGVLTPSVRGDLLAAASQRKTHAERL